MNKADAKQRIEKLRKSIADLRYRYHVENDPTVTDDVYESLTEELLRLEAEFPDFQSASSPTQRVGGVPLDKFEKVRREVPMLSLNNAFSVDDLRAWETRILKLVDSKQTPKDLEYFVELKLDGLSIELEYENGIFTRGSTRGDGYVGEDVTQNLRTIEAIPLEISEKRAIRVRGEVVMLKNVWKRLNEENASEGKPLFANTRNAAAGSIRQLDPKISRARKLNFFAWDIVTPLSEIKKHSEEHTLLKKWGFQVDVHQRVAKNIDDVWKFIEQTEHLREDLDFGMDGVVVMVNATDLHDRIGIVGKAPRYAVAYKYPAEKATTVVKNITVNIGRTGALTPLAMFEPTSVAGSTISKATLHNIEQIERLDVRIGDTVIIQKAGDVIPEVVEVVKDLRTGKEKKFKMPKTCPVCGGAVERMPVGEKSVEFSTAYFCSNPSCPAKNRRAMQHFVNAFEIMAVGPAILDRFKEDGLISDAADLFTLKKEDVEGLERFGEKSAENIINSIRTHSKVTLARFLYALGILHIGEQTSEDLAEAFGSLDRIINATYEEIEALPNFGPVIAKTVHEYFQHPENRKYVQKLLKNGVVIEGSGTTVKENRFKGKSFVLTGGLSTMTRDEAKKRIKELGGSAASSVSKNTDYVVAGSDAGSKLQKAEDLGIAIISESEFSEMIKSS